MPVSTDGVLLGAWTDVTKTHRLLDIGTGTGLLALMCAQRSPDCQIEAIDIDPHAIEAASFNFAQSPWSKRITLHQGDVLSYSFSACFDTIICNPPYFNNGEQAQLSQRATARHSDQLAHSALLSRCYELLTEQGTANFVLPITEGNQFIHLALKNNWYLSRVCHVQPTESKTVNRLLISLVKTPCQSEQQPLIIRKNNQYSNEFVALTRDFYLKDVKIKV